MASLESIIRTAVQGAILETGGNVAAAAKTLDVPLRTMHRMVRRYDLASFIQLVRTKGNSQHGKEQHEA